MQLLFENSPLQLIGSSGRIWIPYCSNLGNSPIENWWEGLRQQEWGEQRSSIGWANHHKVIQTIVFCQQQEFDIQLWIRICEEGGFEPFPKASGQIVTIFYPHMRGHTVLILYMNQSILLGRKRGRKCHGHLRRGQTVLPELPLRI